MVKVEEDRERGGDKGEVNSPEKEKRNLERERN